MVAIRLRRGGAKKKPFYRIVALDSRKKRDGAVLEVLGYYDPKTDPATIKIDMDKYNSWIEKGAKVSETVKNLIKKVG
ncbi:30S ribosomal protein S16 [Hippea jasoniae]|uniref:30S ribosomal protein S16 n=1 Tax=Hippea jasoniae TaxID=944479 RepID=UPI0005569221|nr:30S ribosomal protein S16 [Hippea jasoniae]